jgi:hypothetical protein
MVDEPTSSRLMDKNTVAIRGFQKDARLLEC